MRVQHRAKWQSSSWVARGILRCEEGVPKQEGYRARPSGTELSMSALGLGLGRWGVASPICPR